VNRIYFIGCDMGGWHTKRTDAMAWCAMEDGEWCDPTHVQNGQLFLPDADRNPLAGIVEKILGESAQAVISIDAALGWPKSFRDWVSASPLDAPIPSFDVSHGELNNPFLYRAAERFIKKHTGQKAGSAVKDQLGSNFTKGQALAAWLRREWQAYCPPFDELTKGKAAQSPITVIEIYPSASLKCDAFAKLRWPGGGAMGELGKSDIADAQRAAMASACYARTVGMIQADLPGVYLPEEAGEDEQDMIKAEGWIFSPKVEPAP
jgi:hypothetical protein